MPWVSETAKAHANNCSASMTHTQSACHRHRLCIISAIAKSLVLGHTLLWWLPPDPFLILPSERLAGGPWGHYRECSRAARHPWHCAQRLISPRLALSHGHSEPQKPSQEIQDKRTQVFSRDYISWSSGPARPASRHVPPQPLACVTCWMNQVNDILSQSCWRRMKTEYQPKWFRILGNT